MNIHEEHKMKKQILDMMLDLSIAKEENEEKKNALLVLKESAKISDKLTEINLKCTPTNQEIEANKILDLFGEINALLDGFIACNFPKDTTTN